MDNLESAICDIQEAIAEVRSKRVELDQALEALETRMLEGKSPRRTGTAVRTAARTGLSAGVRGGLPA